MHSFPDSRSRFPVPRSPFPVPRSPFPVLVTPERDIKMRFHLVIFVTSLIVYGTVCEEEENDGDFALVRLDLLEPDGHKAE